MWQDRMDKVGVRRMCRFTVGTELAKEGLRLLAEEL